MEVKFKRFNKDFKTTPEFERKSFLLYKKLDKILFDKKIEIWSFDALNQWFAKDIRLRRTILKYLNYIENRLGAELVNFWSKNKAKINALIEENQFKHFHKKDEKQNEDIIYFNKKIKNKVNNYFLVDELMFSEKLILAKIFAYYYRIKELDTKLVLCIKPKEVNKLISLRNNIAHHNFIINHKNLNWFLNMIPSLIDDKNNWDKKIKQEIEDIKIDFADVL